MIRCFGNCISFFLKDMIQKLLAVYISEHDLGVKCSDHEALIVTFDNN